MTVLLDLDDTLVITAAIKPLRDARKWSEAKARFGDTHLPAGTREFVEAIRAAGSVGIAGGQTGVYPVDSPGGWQLIGRTSVVMFDAAREQPSLLDAGDLVRFVPVA